ncbi:hypothetical protein F4806DRAFT_354666 [Annulohypoxylon nitens]|nr:hypothetical protein F4806DRAFT_354666 [Annulohypoxylon nitens]
MDSDSDIFRLALKCHQMFVGHIKKDDRVNSTPFIQLFRECHYRFNAWASYLGVFALEPTSLDSRLKDAVEVKDLIVHILNTIHDNLHLSLEPSRYQDGLSMLDPTTGSSDSMEFRGPSQIADAIQRSIDRLERLGIAIRQSSNANLRQRTEIVSKSKANASLEELSSKIVRSMYPDVDKDISSYLGRSVFVRYAKLRYIYEHQGDLVEDQNPAPKLKSATDQVDTRSELVKTGNTESSLIVFNREEVKPRSTPNHGVLSIVCGATYPKPPQNERIPGLKTCEWCFENHQTTKFENQNWWVRHVDRDLLPYVCLSEDCMEFMVQFETFEQWKRHMESNHTPEWIEKLYRKEWTCHVDHINPLPFNSPEILKNHMHEHHADILNDIQIKVLAKQSAVNAPRDPGTCPLCHFLIVEDDQATDGDQGPEDNTSSTITTRPRLQGKENAFGLIREKVFQIGRLVIPSQYSLNATASSTDDIATDPSTKLRGQLSVKSPRQKFISHIAMHLRTLCFISLRLKALDEQENLDLEGREYESQGAAVSTAAGSEPDFRLGNAEDHEPLIFDESKSQPGARQNILASWNDQLYVDITDIPQRSSVRSRSEQMLCGSFLDRSHVVEPPDPPDMIQNTINHSGMSVDERAMDILNTIDSIDSTTWTYGCHVERDPRDMLSDIELMGRAPPYRERQPHTNTTNTTQSTSQETDEEAGWDIVSWIHDVAEENS